MRERERENTQTKAIYTILNCRFFCHCLFVCRDGFFLCFLNLTKIKSSIHEKRKHKINDDEEKIYIIAFQSKTILFIFLIFQ